jgi:acetoin utilization deacetylase AcuC-like enzyme
VRIVWSPAYELDLGPHVWPTAKYRLVRERLLAAGALDPAEVLAPGPAAWEDLALVHTSDYLQKVRTGALSAVERWRLEVPWSPALVEGFRLMVGGTVAAARAALDDGVAVHLGGGLHHAFPDHGEGFCLFNDVAVAIRRLQRDGAIRRAAVVDCDVHHGNGTAAVFAGDPTVFTFSIHQEANYPAWKPPSDLDIGLDDGTGDAEYLARLDEALDRVFAAAPALVVYLAGADPYEEDQLGGLALTKEGLRRRDVLVFERARRAGVPLVVTLAGGYARRVEDTVDIHVTTVLEARRVLDPVARTSPA